MFFHPSRLNIVQRWILGNEGLEKLEEFQRHDFRELFKAMKNKPVTIRLLDPPLHEFLPHADQINDDIAKKLGYDDAKKLLSRIESMHEENPMLGYRGCRLGIVRHELTEMQVRAIMHAAADVLKVNTNGNILHPRIMIPLVGCIKEFEDQALLIKKVVEKVLLDVKMKIRYEIGSMIEVPRAALISDKIANLKDEKGMPLCSFFSFGTNDLTQMTMGISRDDSNTFIPKYLETGIYDKDPFQTIDEEGVGHLVHKSFMDGKRANPKISLSVCGE